MKKVLYALTMIMAVACNNQNPFFAEWDTPYGIPDFTKIQEKHYIPAVEAGIAQQQAEIDAIIADQDAPTYENVVVAYERSGSVLDRVSNVLFNVAESDVVDAANCKVVVLVSTGTGKNCFVNNVIECSVGESVPFAYN
jgi:peptidyl-dipeptidase Dcp